MKILTLTDEFTRESLAIEVAPPSRSPRVLTVLDQVIRRRGAPMDVRRANGPEFVARGVQGWRQTQHMQPVYLQPRSPWQNAYGASLHGRVRDEWLNVEWFRTLAEAKAVIGAWQRH